MASAAPQKILLFACLILLFPLTAHSWFLIQENQVGIRIEPSPRKSDTVSSRYVILPNDGEQDNPSGLIIDTGKSGTVLADLIDVDIPLYVLSVQAIDPAMSLDRWIAANLRIKNILEQYLALQERSREALKDLGIPYLDENQQQLAHRRDFTKDVAAEKKLETDMAAIRSHVLAYSQEQGKDISVQTAAGSGQPGKPSAGGDSRSGYENNNQKPRPSPGQDSVGYYNNELPWLFRVVLGAIKYFANNKLELFLWPVVVILLATLVTLMVKRK